MYDCSIRMKHLNAILFLGILTISYHISAPIYAQTQQGWTTHTSKICKLSIDYPSTWILHEKQGRFDTTGVGKLQISTNNTAKGNMPFILFIYCDPHNDLGSLLDETNALQNEMPSDKYKMVEYSHLERNLIGGKDAGVFAVITQHSTDVIPDTGVEVYTVINGTILYQFSYNDSADHFDSPEGKQIRDGILKSIRFTS
jgi:hypothetical protein